MLRIMDYVLGVIMFLFFSAKKSQTIHLRNTANSCAAAVQTLLVLESPAPTKWPWRLSDKRIMTYILE